MIYTLTLNPAVDCYLAVAEETLMDTEVNRAFSQQYRAGGKGINVSMVLAAMGIPSTAIVLLGGFTGDYIKDYLNSQKLISTIALPAEGINRINVKITAGNKMLCVNGRGVIAKEEAKTGLLAFTDSLCENDWVLFCGSLSDGLAEEFAGTIIEQIKAKKARLVIDREELTLQLLAKYRPYLIKPNLYEFNLLFSNDKNSKKQIIEQLDWLTTETQTAVLLSLGEKGAILAKGDMKYRVRPPYVKGINKVGCGDALLAAFVGCLAEGRSETEALAWAGGAGTAVAVGSGEVSYELIREYKDQQSVEIISKGEKL